MLKAFSLLLCATGAAWLIYTFGFGMLVAVGAAAAAAVLLSDGRVPELDAARSGQAAGHPTTEWAGF